MNKNLKKVISAAAALTISASSFAAFAVDFPDVEATASYAQAVQELSALNVISGFEDGTFRPDELVTRAQITKMIVDALGKTKVAESAKNVATKFADVPAGENGHWAAGYVATAVSSTSSFIAGYDDYSFGPDDNVTYIQAQKMLVAALGYEGYAQEAGGWPSGYASYASQKGITKGVDAMADDQLTRAQVAQMIDNAMDVPVVVVDKYTATILGSQPEYVTKDGTGKGYETLFTRLNTYKVYGRVEATSKTEPGIDTDQVRFTVEKAENFDDEYVKSSDDATFITDEMYFGDTNAEDMLKIYAQALIRVNDDDEYEILSIVPAAANKSVDLLAEDVDTYKTDLANGYIYFYPTGTKKNSVRYQLADAVELYVNGVKVTENFGEAEFQKYIVGNDTAKVQLQKITETGSTNASSKYNLIMVTNYVTAVVDQVTDKATETTITFKSGFEAKRKMTILKDDNQYTYSFTKNGEAVDPATLNEYDVLSIAYDVATGFEESRFYDVLVSSDTAEGKYSGKNNSGEYTLSGTKYKLASNYITKDQAPAFETSTEYTLYLDSFGRIADYDEVAASKKIGIIKNVYEKTNGDKVVELINNEGTVAEFTADDDQYTLFKTEYDKAKTAASGNLAKQYALSAVEYQTTNNGTKIKFKNVAKNQEVVTNGEYKVVSDKIGSVRLSDSTVILDVQNVNKKKDDVKVVALDSLKDGNTYDVIGYDKSTSDNTYRFVVMTKGDQGVDYTSQLAVFLEAGTSADNEDGTEYATMTVIEDGEIKTVLVDEDYDINVNDFAEGDVIAYSLNTAGYVEDVLEITTTAAVPASYNTMRDNFIAGKTILSAADKSVLNNGTDDEVAVEYGVIVKNGKAYTFVPVKDVKNGTVDVSNGIDITVGDSTKIYTYNFSNNPSDFGRLELDNGLAISADSDAAYEDKTNDDIFSLGHEDVKDELVFAVIKTIDDVATEVVQFVAE